MDLYGSRASLVNRSESGVSTLNYTSVQLVFMGRNSTFHLPIYQAWAEYVVPPSSELG